MKRGTILILVALVAVLAWLTWQRRKAEQSITDVTPEVAMFDGFRPERVRVLRIDHLVRGVQLRLERDASGRWNLSEPVPYPAEGSLVRTILDQIAGSRGPVDGEPNLPALGLDEPRVVLEAVEVLADGEERPWRVEIGDLDLDERWVNVRVPGHSAAPSGDDAAVLRIARTLRTTLERNPDDYRDTRATSLSSRGVDRFTRRGAVVRAGNELVPLDLDASRAGTWRKTDAPAVRLDERTIGFLVQGASDLRVDRFVDDAPRDLSRYWLDEPRFTVELQGKGGEVAKLLFSYEVGPGAPPAEEAAWFAMREGFPHVWEVEWRDIDILATPAHMLVDTRILHALREDVLRVELAAADRRLVVELEARTWWITEEREGVDAARYPADPGKVEDLLAILEKAELGDCPQDVASPLESEVSLSITSRTGELFGGRIGEAWRDPESGRAGRVYLRHGDEMLQLVDEKVVALWDPPLDDLRSLVLFDVDEFLVDRVRIASGETEHVFYRDQKEWREGTSRMTAPLETQILIGDLMRISAAAWLAPDAEASPAERIEVRLWGRFPGQDETLVFARDAEGRGLLLPEGGQAARLDSDLHARLVGLFR